MHGDRVARTLTFWLRPDFVLRVVSRFQQVAGFDRSIALASGALTATIPLMIVTSAVATQVGGRGAADRIIARYDLTGGGAEAVRDVFSPPTGTSTSLGVIGVLFLMVAVLSFSRAVQRLFEQTWELEPLSVRNTLNGLLWIAGLSLYVGVTGLLHAAIGAGRARARRDAAVPLPLSVVFLSWGGWVLSAKRIAHRDLLPFAILGAVLLAAYSVGATVYVPHLFDTYATRYGVIGAVFAMISTLFIVMVIIVGLGGRRPRDPRRARPHPARREARRGRGPAPVGLGSPPRRAPAGRRCASTESDGRRQPSSRADGPRARVTLDRGALHRGLWRRSCQRA